MAGATAKAAATVSEEGSELALAPAKGDALSSKSGLLTAEAVAAFVSNGPNVVSHPIGTWKSARGRVGGEEGGGEGRGKSGSDSERLPSGVTTQLSQHGHSPTTPSPTRPWPGSEIWAPATPDPVKIPPFYEMFTAQMPPAEQVILPGPSKGALCEAHKLGCYTEFGSCSGCSSNSFWQPVVPAGPLHAHVTTTAHAGQLQFRGELGSATAGSVLELNEGLEGGRVSFDVGAMSEGSDDSDSEGSDNRSLRPLGQQQETISTRQSQET